jgi:hypothetical protein
MVEVKAAADMAHPDAVQAVQTRTPALA